MNKKSIAEKYNWKNTYTPLTVEEGRKIAASHGVDGMVVVTWINDPAKKGNILPNVITVGKTREDADNAVTVRDAIANALNYKLTQLVEDRRDEHSE